MSIEMDQFRETFFDEAAEHLESMEVALLGLEGMPDDPEQMNALFRSAHSIKGSGGTFGLTKISEFAHALETLLDRMRSGSMEMTSDRIDLMLTSCDVLGGLLKSTRAGLEPPEQLAAARDQLHDALGIDTKPEQEIAAESIELAQVKAIQTFQVDFAPSSDCFRQGIDPIMLLSDLAELGEVASILLDSSRLPRFDSFDPESCYLAWKLTLRSEAEAVEIEDVFLFLDEESQFSIRRLELEIAKSGSTSRYGESSSRHNKVLFVGIPEDQCVRFVETDATEMRRHTVENAVEAKVAVRLAIEDGERYCRIYLDCSNKDSQSDFTVAELRRLEKSHHVFGHEAARIFGVITEQQYDGNLRLFQSGCDELVTFPTLLADRHHCRLQ